jgi:hypothetical protein
MTLFTDKEFEALDEDGVRTKLASNEWALLPTKSGLAELWLKSKDDARAAASSAKRDAREDETLAIAREANSIARDALRAVRKDRYIAIAAIIIAAIAAHKEIKWLITSVISWLR